MVIALVGTIGDMNKQSMETTLDLGKKKVFFLVHFFGA